MQKERNMREGEKEGGRNLFSGGPLVSQDTLILCAPWGWGGSILERQPYNQSVEKKSSCLD